MDLKTWMASTPISSHMQRELYENEDVYVVKENDTFSTINNKILDPRNKRKATVMVDRYSRVTGLIRSIDLVNFFSAQYENLVKEGGLSKLNSMTAREITELREKAVSSYPFPSFPCVHSDDTVEDALIEMKRRKEFKSHPSKDVVIIGENGEFYGFLTRMDILRESFNYMF